MLHDGEVVRDEQVRQVELVLQIHQQVDDLRLNRHVKGGHRLVRHDQFGSDGERARDADPLSLTAGELVGIVVHLLGPQTDPLEKSGDPVLLLGAVSHAVRAQWLRDEVAGREPRIERGIGVLKDHLHVAAAGTHLLDAETRDVLALEADRAAGWRRKTHHRAADC